MDWVISAVTIFANLLLGAKNKWGWIIMLIMNGMWIGYVLNLTPPQYGLLPAIFVNCGIAIFSARKWFMDEVFAKKLRDMADERTTE